MQSRILLLCAFAGVYTYSLPTAAPTVCRPVSVCVCHTNPRQLVRCHFFLRKNAIPRYPKTCLSHVCCAPVPLISTGQVRLILVHCHTNPRQLVRSHFFLRKNAIPRYSKTCLSHVCCAPVPLISTGQVRLILVHCHTNPRQLVRCHFFLRKNAVPRYSKTCLSHVCLCSSSTYLSRSGPTNPSPLCFKSNSS